MEGMLPSEEIVLSPCRDEVDQMIGDLYPFVLILAEILTCADIHPLVDLT